MIIKNSAIQLNSSHQSLKKTEESEKLRFWKTEAPPANRNGGRPQEAPADEVNLSKTAQTLKPETQSLDLSQAPDAKHGVMLLIIRDMVRKLTGKEFEIFSADKLASKPDNASAPDASAPDTKNVEITTTPPPSAGFGLVYEHNTSYQESESTSFSSTGTIQTKDGKSIEFSAQLNMSRDFYMQTNLAVTAGDPEKKVDPLVINFDGNAAELSQTHFAFDIDSNGTPEQIAALKPGSGYLALDKNNDGIIDNGSELFGPNSGNGFAELAKYDSDHNGFIDQADPIYNSLRIWQRNADGSQQLLALGDKNIGAIYLGHATTPFQLKTEDNKSLGEVTDSGVYLTEDGKVGTVQQINLSA